MVTTSTVRIGLAACVILAAGASVQAQTAASQPAAEPTSCSGFFCMVAGKPQPTPAPQPAVPAAPAAEDQQSAIPERATVKKALKPVKEPVTIAVDWTDVNRLKQLVAAMPGSKVRLVKPSAASVDFKVTAALGDSGRETKVKLFSEQVHILAGGQVKSVADLKDKVVSFGPADGPARAVARKAFEALGVAVKETPLDYTNAFDGLATGDVDAVVVVAPQPSAYLAGLRASGLHLVAWPDDVAPPSGASIGAIAGTGYPNLAKPGETIRTVAVDAVLNMSAKGAREPAARAFFASLSQHSAALSKRGFDLLKADLDERGGRRVASAERR